MHLKKQDRSTASPVFHWIILLAMVLACSACNKDDEETLAAGLDSLKSESVAAAIGETRPVRLTIGHDSRLTIGKILPTFPYDARGSYAVGSMTYAGEGRAELYFPAKAEDLYIPPLPMIYIADNLPLRVDIAPADLTGTIDFNTGEVSLGFDAAFYPVCTALYRPDPLAVNTALTTEISCGEFMTVSGERLNEWGDLRLVGVAEIPESEDAFVNTLLTLPTDAVTDMGAHLDFPEGTFGDPFAEKRVRMETLKEGRLSIYQYPQFAYDGDGGLGEGTWEYVEGSDALADITFENFAIPALEVMPGIIPNLAGADEQYWMLLDALGYDIDPDADTVNLGFVRIDIEVISLEGQADLQTGWMELVFDAIFTPMIFGLEFPSISVATTITTETSAGLNHETTGERMDLWGDALLVGVAVVPQVTADDATPVLTWLEGEFVNLLLQLPSDAVCELPVHMDFTGQEVLWSR